MMRKERKEPQWPTPGSEPFQNELKRLKEFIGYQSILMNSPQKKKPTEDKKVEIGLNLVKMEKSKPEVNQVEIFNEIKHKKEAKIMNWAK